MSPVGYSLSTVHWSRWSPSILARLSQWRYTHKKSCPVVRRAVVAQWSRYRFEPSTTKDPPCEVAMHVKSVKRPPVGVVW
ncbi:hypothetical protein TNCV_4273081 [Trichonephila clavipes]|nr:hypothetical protein TNCV_4273081 [Trichonephila clavipes]